jgi:hypothetical protein
MEWMAGGRARSSFVVTYTCTHTAACVAVVDYHNQMDQILAEMICFDWTRWFMHSTYGSGAPLNSCTTSAKAEYHQRCSP